MRAEVLALRADVRCSTVRTNDVLIASGFAVVAAGALTGWPFALGIADPETAKKVGIRSLARHLGGPDFARLRLGIGKPEVGDMASYVLRRFTPEETRLAADVLDQAVRGLETYIRSGLEEAMQ